MKVCGSFLVERLLNALPFENFSRSLDNDDDALTLAVRQQHFRKGGKYFNKW